MTESKTAVDKAASQGTPKIASSNQTLGRGKERFFLRDFRVKALLTPWFQIFHIRNHERINFCCFKHLITQFVTYQATLGNQCDYLIVQLAKTSKCMRLKNIYAKDRDPSFGNFRDCSSSLNSSSCWENKKIERRVGSIVLRNLS